MMKAVVLCASVCLASAIHLNPGKPKLADQAQEEALEAQSTMLPTEMKLWEAAAKEAGLERSQISKFGQSVVKYPKSVVDKLLSLEKTTYKTHKHKYNFFGRISGTFKTGVEEKARKWAMDFAQANFSNDDVFVSTRFDGKWKTLGAFDKSHELGLGKRDSHNFVRINSDNKIDMTYWDVMLGSDYTLCPGGDDRWSFRGYEAALAGSICIIKDEKTDWSPMLTSGYPNPNKVIVNTKMKPLDEVFKLFKFKKVDEPESFAQYDEEMAEHNRKIFIKYMTFIEGDNVPPAMETPKQPAKLMVQESEVGTTTITKKDGKAVCEGNCHGDVSDMIHPFYRHSMNLQRQKIYGEQIKSFSVPADTYFWNAKEAAQCFKNKYVVMLGDSTLLENLNDIIMLLNGGPSKRNVVQMYTDFTRIPKHSLHRYTTPFGLMKQDNRMNRDQTITIQEQGTTIKFQYIGAVNLTDNCQGLSSILQSPLKEKIEGMIEHDEDGRKPDAVVIQSGPHDMCHALYTKDHFKTYYDALDSGVSNMMNRWKQSGSKVIWRGNYRFKGENQDIGNPKVKNEQRYPKKLDDEAKRVVEENGGDFVDVARILANYHDETGCCSTIDSATTVSPHFGSVAVRQYKKSSAFFSQLATYKILDNICK